jgi:hypothetical protein
VKNLYRRPHRWLLGCALLAGTITGGMLGTHSAHAQFAVCYGDPIVLLSNGRALDLNVTIQDAVSDVQGVDYTLHGPAGTQVVDTYSSTGLPPKLESFQYIADDAPGTYDVTTTLTTRSSGVSFTAGGILANVSSLNLKGLDFLKKVDPGLFRRIIANLSMANGVVSTSASGVSGQPVALQLIDPAP